MFICHGIKIGYELELLLNMLDKFFKLHVMS
jgi:hypothetical protein